MSPGPGPGRGKRRARLRPGAPPRPACVLKLLSCLLPLLVKKVRQTVSRRGASLWPAPRRPSVELLEIEQGRVGRRPEGRPGLRVVRQPRAVEEGEEAGPHVTAIGPPELGA